MCLKIHSCHVQLSFNPECLHKEPDHRALALERHTENSIQCKINWWNSVSAIQIDLDWVVSLILGADSWDVLRPTTTCRHAIYDPSLGVITWRPVSVMKEVFVTTLIT